MSNINKGDYVILKSTSDIGEVIDVERDSARYQVRARGSVSTYFQHEIITLTPEQIIVLNQALSSIARVIDEYHDDDVYEPIYNAEGFITYSSSAAAVFRILEFPKLIVELDNLATEVTLLRRALENLAETSDE